jgi:hypothetical protein
MLHPSVPAILFWQRSLLLKAKRDSGLQSLATSLAEHASRLNAQCAADVKGSAESLGQPLIHCHREMHVCS